MAVTSQPRSQVRRFSRLGRCITVRRLATSKTCHLAQQERISTGLVVLPDMIDSHFVEIVVFDAPKVIIPWIWLIT